MIDIEHKSLEAIKNNLDNINDFFKDKKKIERIMNEPKTIDAWDKSSKVLMYQRITQIILDNYDINEIVKNFINFERDQDKTFDISIFKAVAYGYYLFLKKVYDIYLLDQIYYLLRSDIDFSTYVFDKPFKNGSRYETVNFEISIMQTSLNSNNEDVDIRLYNLKEYYISLINKLLQDKKYLYKKAYLNDCLGRNSKNSNNYYVWQLYLALNSLVKSTKLKKKKTKRKAKDQMQLVLKNF